MEKRDADSRRPRVVQPGEVALMLPDEFERRLAASASNARQLAFDGVAGALNSAFSVEQEPKP